MSTWREQFNACLERMTATLADLRDPERLQQRPQYRKRPTEGWLGGLPGALQSQRHLLHLAGRAGEATDEETRLLEEWVQAARESVERNLAWVREQLHREMEALVGQYHRAYYWVAAIRDGLPGEFWFVLNERDKIEGHLRASELHPALQPDPTLVQRVQETDALLREVGLELWQRDMPTGGADDAREWITPREHWWWWLDKGDARQE